MELKLFAGSKFPTLLESLCCDESVELEPHVAKACHLLASDVIPWALWEIFVAACKQRIIPTTWTIVDTWKDERENNAMKIKLECM